MAEADEALVTLSTRLAEVKNKLLCESRTAKLQYLYEMDTVKMFIQAECCGDWNLHLIAVTRMLSLFAAAVHFQYAKCARLYLQSMRQVPETHPWLHAQFEEHGFHAVRRSDRCWSGLWTHLVIEQVLIRSLKSRGGLTHGRGMTVGAADMDSQHAQLCRDAFRNDVTDKCCTHVFRSAPGSRRQ